MGGHQAALCEIGPIRRSRAGANSAAAPASPPTSTRAPGKTTRHRLDRGTLLLSVRDDGVGGADFGRGSGLVGLQDRVEALGGAISVESARGSGTSLVVTLPLDVEPMRG